MELGTSHNKFIILSSHDIDQSVSSGADFLIVDPKDKTLMHFPTGTSKEAIVEKAFSWLLLIEFIALQGYEPCIPPHNFDVLSRWMSVE